MTDIEVEGDIPPGTLAKSFTVRCFLCYHDETLTRGVIIDGRRSLYRDTVAWMLRNVHGWHTRKGKWHCPDCIRTLSNG